MSEWQPIETAPNDGLLRLFCTRGGSIYIAPDVKPTEPSVQEKRRMLEVAGEWPSASYLPAYWMPLPDAPTHQEEGRG